MSPGDVSPECWDYRHGPQCLSFTWVLGILTHIFMLIGKHFPHCTISQRPMCSFWMKIMSMCKFDEIIKIESWWWCSQPHKKRTAQRALALLYQVMPFIMTGFYTSAPPYTGAMLAFQPAESQAKHTPLCYKTQCVLFHFSNRINMAALSIRWPDRTAPRGISLCSVNGELWKGDRRYIGAGWLSSASLFMSLDGAADASH